LTENPWEKKNLNRKVENEISSSRSEVENKRTARRNERVKRIRHGEKRTAGKTGLSEGKRGYMLRRLKDDRDGSSQPDTRRKKMPLLNKASRTEPISLRVEGKEEKGSREGYSNTIEKEGRIKTSPGGRATSVGSGKGDRHHGEKKSCFN